MFVTCVLKANSPNLERKITKSDIMPKGKRKINKEKNTNTFNLMVIKTQVNTKIFPPQMVKNGIIIKNIKTPITP